MKIETKSLIIFSSVVTIITLYLLFLITISLPIEEISISKAATLGDSFGILNALFSGCAFGGIIITILLQREELNESRKIFKAQKFEDAFYRLLGFYKENLNEISVHDNTKGTTYRGVGGLSHQLKRFNASILNFKKLSHDNKMKEVYNYLIYKEVKKIIIPQSRYLGTMESILSLIMHDVEEPDKKNFYIKIVTSQLTVHEIKYIFYRCLVSKTDSTLVHLVNESRLIDKRISELKINNEIINLYNEAHGTNFSSIKDEQELVYTEREEKRLIRLYASYNKNQQATPLSGKNKHYNWKKP